MSERIRGDADSLPVVRSNGADGRPGACHWPQPPRPEAFHGIVGEITRVIEPQTEADPAAILAQILIISGNVVGRSAHLRIEATSHFANEFLLIVGETSKARKGTSWDRAIEPMRLIDPDWVDTCVVSGLSSGEGVIWEVRDPVIKLQRQEKGGPLEEVTVDAGVADKRLMLVATEFGSVLRTIGRQGSILSPVLRDAWDKGLLRTLTKTSPARSTGAHISMVAHITMEELQRELDDTEIANGFANRFLIFCAKRSKLLPFGGKPIDWSDVAARLDEIIAAARIKKQILWTKRAQMHWIEVYPTLSEGRPGLFGAITGRAEAHVARIAMLYAVLDRQNFIDYQHLEAALAVWEYAEASAAFVFGDALGDPVADEILRALRQVPAGMSRTDIANHFKRHQSASRIGLALETLRKQGLAVQEQLATGGRPVEVWRTV